MTDNLLGLLSRLTTVRIDKFADSGQIAADSDDRTDAGITEGANAVCSRIAEQPPFGDQNHAVLLDLDVPAYLVPSSTPGHSHLYIDVAADETSYYALLDALVAAHVIDPNYAQASKNKGGTHLRLPWVKKSGQPTTTLEDF